MPIYEYQCQDCNKTFELLRSIKDADLAATCKNCESIHTRRIQSACFSKVAGGTTTNSGGGCAGCSGGSCSSCSH